MVSLAEPKEFWEALAIKLEELVKRRVERALPRGGVRDLSLAVSVERRDDGEVSLTVEAEVQAHPGVKRDVESVVEEAIAEAFKEVDEELSRRGLKPAG